VLIIQDSREQLPLDFSGIEGVDKVEVMGLAYGDYSAIVSMALDNTGLIYVDANMARRPPAQIIADCIGIVREFDPHAIGVETNGFQEMLVHQLFEQAAKDNVALPPIEKIVHASTSKKASRVIASLDPYLAPNRREFRFRRSRGGALLLSQLREFPKGDYDDGPDAMEMCLMVLKKLFHGEYEQ
jgi:predicted phage terminase large subunit-like protein